MLKIKSNTNEFTIIFSEKIGKKINAEKFSVPALSFFQLQRHTFLPFFFFLFSLPFFSFLPTFLFFLVHMCPFFQSKTFLLQPKIFIFSPKCFALLSSASFFFPTFLKASPKLVAAQKSLFSPNVLLF